MFSHNLAGKPLQGCKVNIPLPIAPMRAPPQAAAIMIKLEAIGSPGGIKTRVEFLVDLITAQHSYILRQGTVESMADALAAPCDRGFEIGCLPKSMHPAVGSATANQGSFFAR